MRARDALGLVVFGALSVGVAVLAARVADRHRGTRLEVSRVKPSQVDAAARARLAALEDPVLVSYYVSPRAEMPSELRRLQDEVTDVLEAMKRASDGKLDWQVLDPHAARAGEDEPVDAQAQVWRPETERNARFAARQGIAPFRVRSVEHDRWSERTIWSALTLAYGARPPVVLNGVTSEHVPRLMATLLAYLDQLDAPRRPLVAVAAPSSSGGASSGGASGGGPGYGRLAEELGRKADVVRVDLEGDAPFPADADLLFWMEPAGVAPARLAELDRFLASGRSAVIAGSPLAARIGGRDLRPAGPFDYRIEPSRFDADALWGHLGLRPAPGLLCDKFAVLVPEPGNDQGGTPIPFLVRCIAPQQDFRATLGSLPNGTLLFEAAAPLRLDNDVLAERGSAAEVLATTSDGTWIAPLPDGLADARALAPAPELEASRQALAVHLAPADPWEGPVVAFASAAPFRDDWLDAEGFAHRRLIDVLVRGLATDARLVANRTAVARAEPLPELPPERRLLLRALCIGALPLLFVAAGLARGGLRRRGPSAPGGARLAGRAAAALPFAAGLALALALARAADLLPARADVTRDGLNRLASATHALAAAARGDGAVEAEVIVSAREKLPPAMRPAVDGLEDLLAELRRAGAELTVRRTAPEDEPGERRLELERAGVVPVRVSTREEGVTTVRTVYSALRLTARGRSELLRLPEPSSFEDLEFRVAFALWRLAEGRRPRVAFASDTPRLSPAEAHSDYQTKGLFAPSGDDPYSLARALIAEVGFDVEHVNPRDPRFRGDPDALIWLQPRREARPMIDALARYLHGGGRALLAAQHFVMQARQYRGTNFKTVYWPQPQTPDLDLYWLPEVGIELVRDVVLDELSTRRGLETQVNRDATRRDYEAQESALPFLVRASAASYADDPLLAGVGDLSLPFPNRLRWDAARLAELGIAAETLATTSERAWSFAWTGGYLPDAVLAGPPAADAQTDELRRIGRAPLAARFRGPFPLPVAPLLPAGVDDALARGLSARPPAPGELVLVGASEAFKDPALFDREFRADHLLVNAAAALCLPPDLARVAGRRRTAPGLDWVDDAAKQRWRGLVQVAGPAALLLVAGAIALVRRGPARAAAAARARALSREGSRTGPGTGGGA